VAEPSYGLAGDGPIEVVPVVVLSQIFTARPSSIPDIRDFVRRCLAESPLTEDGNRQVEATVFRALLDAAGPTGSIQVAFRIFPEHVEVDVLHSDTALHATPAVAPPPSPAADTTLSATGREAQVPGGSLRQLPVARQPTAGPGSPESASPAASSPTASSPAAGSPAAQTAASRPGGPEPSAPVVLGAHGHPASFAEWMSTALRREGLTQEAAARQLGVSVKTVSRWVGGATEPRMRDLRRIQEVFGEVPLP
jgi:DNA-binding XRE family transcriptional regulator